LAQHKKEGGEEEESTRPTVYGTAKACEAWGMSVEMIDPKEQQREKGPKQETTTNGSGSP